MLHTTLPLFGCIFIYSLTVASYQIRRPMHGIPTPKIMHEQLELSYYLESKNKTKDAIRASKCIKYDMYVCGCFYKLINYVWLQVGLDLDPLMRVRYRLKVTVDWWLSAPNHETPFIQTQNLWDLVIKNVDKKEKKGGVGHPYLTSHSLVRKYLFINSSFKKKKGLYLC